ncbi:MAG: HD domain-containing protein [Desulfarculaceae bacterium]|nr:HD domain-containing protein [Desulfarculaceae bacterium]
MEKNIADLLFEAKILKELPRSGYHFLGTGRENVAEHSFMTVFIVYAISSMEPDIDREKLLKMALLHDLPEARTGDFNYVQKKYAEVKEEKAVSDLIEGLPFGNEIKEMIDEFNTCRTREAQLVNDADQISFLLELKKLKDTGSGSCDKWIEFLLPRIQTDTGKLFARKIMETRWDNWWMNSYSE